MQANFLLLIRDSAIAGGLQLPFTQCQTPDNIVGYKVKVIRQSSVITGQCWGIHSYSWVDRDHSRDCDGKGNWETSQNQSDGRGKQGARLQIVTRGYFIWGLIQKYFQQMWIERLATGSHCERKIIHSVWPICDNPEKGTENVRWNRQTVIWVQVQGLCHHSKVKASRSFMFVSSEWYQP